MLRRVCSALMSRQALLLVWLCGEAGRAAGLIALLTQGKHIRLTVDGTIGDGSGVSPRQRGLP